MRADQAVTGSLDAAARVLAFYLKAAWSIEPKVQSLAAQSDDGEMRADRPLVTEPVLFLPDARVACDEPADEALFYLASAAHAAAHLTWSTARFEQGKLRPLQVALVGAFEDARVERLAVLRYPGLRQWWLPFHRTGTQGARTAPALIARLSRALLDPDYADDDGWVTKGRRLFDAAFAVTHGADPAISRELGNLLGNDLGQMRVQFNAKTYAQEAAYRDDNSLVWNAEPTPIAHAPDDAPAERNATLQESPNLREPAARCRATASRTRCKSARSAGVGRTRGARRRDAIDRCLRGAVSRMGLCDPALSESLVSGGVAAS